MTLQWLQSILNKCGHVKEQIKSFHLNDHSLKARSTCILHVSFDTEFGRERVKNTIIVNSLGYEELRLYLYLPL